MRFRATAAAVSTAAGLLLAPFASVADAVPTTSTVVAYAADTNGNGVRELYTRPADGSGAPTRVYQNTHDVRMTALSPDGTLLAYTLADLQYGGYTHWRLYVRPTSGGTGPGTLVLDAHVPSSVGWSADGQRLVASGYDYLTDAWQTWIVNADGSGPRVVVPTTTRTYGEEPSFSPSGDLVAIDAFDADYEYVGIDLISLATGKRARVAGTAGGSDPVWSPDGQHLLFQRYLPTCGVGLYRVPVSGGTPVSVREVPNRFLGSAEYSRDGSQLFWSDAPMKECGTTAKADIWVGNADGTGAANVTNTATVHEIDPTVAGGTPVAADTTAPAAPVPGAATLNGTSATLPFTVSDDDAAEYVVLRKAPGDPAPTSPTDGTVAYRGPARPATVPGLDVGFAYDLYVFAIDSSGNVSPVSGKRSLRALGAPMMQASPRVGIGTVGTTITVSVRTVDNPAASWQILVGENKKSSTGVWSTSPTYTTLFASTTEPKHYVTGTPGRTYYYKARAYDEFGNVTAYGKPSSETVPLDDAWSGFSWAPGLAAKTAADRYLGGYRTTITRNAAMTARVDTKRFVLVGDRCRTCGKFQVYVDGVLKGTFDSYSSWAATRPRQILYASGTFSTIKPHTIKVVPLGTSGRPRVSIDGLAVLR